MQAYLGSGLDRLFGEFFSDISLLLELYSVSREKRDNNVSCSIFYKTRAILIKFDTQFPRINLLQND